MTRDASNESSGTEPPAPPRDESLWALAAARARSAPVHPPVDPRGDADSLLNAGVEVGSTAEAAAADSAGTADLIDVPDAAAVGERVSIERAAVADPDRMPPARGPQVRKPTWHFMFAHPAHVLGLGFGSGLSPWAPGTVGTLWAWLVFRLLQPYLDDMAWAALIAASLVVGWWACTVTARHMGVADPGAIVWDEVIAFWIVLWLIGPTTLLGETCAFALFRFFDAAKPGPVAWADALFKGRRGKPIGWAQGFGIVFDDLVAALCALLVIAVWRLW